MILSFIKKLTGNQLNYFKRTQPQKKLWVEPLSQSTLIYKALFKTCINLLSPKIWVIGLIPLLISALLWGALNFFFWDTVVVFFNTILMGIEFPNWLPDWIPNRSVWIPLSILLLSLPLVMITALLLVNTFGMQTITHRVAKEYGLNPMSYTQLERSTNTVRSIGHSVWIITVLGIVWIISLPTWFIAGLGFFIQLLLMAWANSRLFSYDILIDFADKTTRNAIIKLHRTTLFNLGLLTSIPAFLPSILWLTGGFWIVFLPLIACIALWLSIMIFIASILLFSHYLIPALLHYQKEQIALTEQLDTALNGEIIDASITEKNVVIKQLHTHIN